MATRRKTAALDEVSEDVSPQSGTPSAGGMPWTRPMPWASGMRWTPPMPWGMRGLAPDDSRLGDIPIAKRDDREITGDDILAVARQHLNEPYVLGARAPMGNPNWKGPWDCAEFVSWCLYQASRILFGTEPRGDPVRADAYTGYWAQQCREENCMIPAADAIATVGAILLRYPLPGAIGHIVFSDGHGGTVEAHSSKFGVIAGKVQGRRWDTGVLVPGIRYFQSGLEIEPEAPVGVIRLTHPLTRSDLVQKIQRRLIELGYAPGADDGVYGPQTAHAVTQFQAENGLVADGEVGPSTQKTLGL